MSAQDRSTDQSPINGRLTGYFENGFFLTHQNSAATDDMISPTSTPTAPERPASPEWYYEPSSLDQLNPTGVRAGSSYPALQTPGNKSSRGRDSVDDGDETPRKKRRVSPKESIKQRLQRLWPFSVPAPSPRKLPLTCCRTQSETALGQYPLEVEVDKDMPLMTFWALTGYMYEPIYKPVRPARPRTVSSPPVMAYRGSDRVRWWTPSACPPRSSDLRQNDVSASASDEVDMSEPVSPVTQVPASPRIEGESKDEDMFERMETLVI
jgi:hypothetical protein